MLGPVVLLPRASETLTIIQLRAKVGKVPGGTPRKIGQVSAARFPKHLLYCMTKICDVPYPIYDLNIDSKPYL